ncbi:MAG: hypothetical protein AAF559_03500 [Pseudomonadota bacterium]
MLEIETSEEIDGRFSFERVETELRALEPNSDGYLVLYCPTQGTLRVELYQSGFSIERHHQPGKVHYQIAEPNEGENLSISDAIEKCRAFYEGSSC